MASTSKLALSDLERDVMEAYLREADSSTHFQRKSSAATLTIKDLQLEGAEPASRSEIIMLEVFEAWRKLVYVVKKDGVFVQYIDNLSRAFREVAVMDKSLYGHMSTLTNLLVHTAQHQGHDESTECRFITLLEVILSYGRRWRPSEHVSQFWVRLSQRIPPDVPPVNFRRKAYRVLVSLSWVPSSKGLLAACSFDEARQRIDPAQSPPPARAYFDRIAGGRPQPRFDCVNQVLDRLKDETDVRVAITSDQEGMGKTTVAALVASHPSILRVFTVLWLDDLYGPGHFDPPTRYRRGRRASWTQAAPNGGTAAAAAAASVAVTAPPQVLTYRRYTELLDALCRQLGLAAEWPEPQTRLEEPALQRLRDRDLMAAARERMVALLGKYQRDQQRTQKRDGNILLVLDHVEDESIVDLFRFNERQSTIVTSSRALPGVDWTVELAAMSDEEAVELFLTEAGLAPDHIFGLTVETRTVIQHCDRHPLTVRTAARWFRMKSVTAGYSVALTELVNVMTALKSSHGSGDSVPGQRRDSEKKPETPRPRTPFLFDMLALALAPKRIVEVSDKTTILFYLCLASMSAIFPRDTPLDTVLLLWEQILKSDGHAVQEVSQDDESLPPAELKNFALKQAAIVTEGLLHLGIIFFTEEQPGANVIEVHHKVYRDFALHMAEELKLADSFGETVLNWNKAFVTAYFTEQIQGTLDQLDHNCQEYAHKYLPSHIFRARMLPIAENMLGDEKFFQARIETMGWDRAVRVHIQDCFKLQQMLNATSEEDTGLAPRLSPVFEQIASTISSKITGDSTDPEVVLSVAHAICEIGIALAENGYFNEATEYLERSWNMSPYSQHLQARLLYFSAWVQLSTNQCERALKLVRGSRKLIEEAIPDHDMYYEVLLLQGEALVGECEYKEAVSFFNEICDSLRPKAGEHPIEFGTFLFEKGLLLLTMGDMEEAETTLAESIDWKLGKNESSRSLALAYKALGDICIERRKVNAAKDSYEKGLKILDSMKISQDDVDYLLLTGRISLMRKDWVECILALRRARSLIKEKPNVFMDISAADLRFIAKTYHQRGDYENAVSVLQDSLALTDTRLYSLERAAGLLELAKVLLDQDQPGEGLVCLEQSLEITILKLGECVQLLDTLNAIGNVQLSQGAYEEALTVFYKVDELTRRLVPDDIERVAGVLYSIGEVHDAKKDFTEAIQKFNECMQVLRSERGPDHPHIAKALQRLGDVTVMQKDFEKANDYYAQALRIRKIDQDERNLAETLHSIGVLARKQKRLDDARETLMEALKIRQKLANARETGENLLELGNIYRLQGDMESAISLYEKSLEVLDEKDDVRGSVYMALSHAKLAEKLEKRALKCCERALEIRLSAYGKDNLKTGNVSRSLGIIKYLLNRGDEALVHLNEFVRVIELNDDEENEEEGKDVDYLLTVILMHDIHKANGRMEQAKNLLDVAKDVCEDSEEVRDELPELISMTKFRVNAEEEKETFREVEKEKKGLLARLNLAHEEGVLGRLTLDPCEVEVLRNIPFIDD